MFQWSRLSTPRRKMLLLAIGLLAGDPAALAAQDGPPGITTPVVFAPFDPNAPACNAPPGLHKTLAFAQDNEREFMQGVSRGLAMAAKDRGLEYQVRHRRQRSRQDD